jgi:hypothetical protein
MPPTANASAGRKQGSRTEREQVSAPDTIKAQQLRFTMKGSLWHLPALRSSMVRLCRMMGLCDELMSELGTDPSAYCRATTRRCVRRLPKGTPPRLIVMTGKINVEIGRCFRKFKVELAWALTGSE